MKLVITEYIQDIQCSNYSTREAKRETKKVENTVCFITPEQAQGNFYKTFKHIGQYKVIYRSSYKSIHLYAKFLNRYTCQGIVSATFI